MFGSNKNTKAVEDESLRDKSKFVVVGFTVMIVSFLTLIFGEIYTSIQLSKQAQLIAGSGGVREQSDNIVIEMAKVGKDVNKAEYEYIQEIMKFMSPTEFQNFKNSISGMATKFDVQINSLNEGKADGLGKIYAVNYVEYQFLSTFENLTKLKKNISDTGFKINIVEETIERESPISNKVRAEGKIGVYVFPGKEKLLKDKASIIEQFAKEEDKTKPEDNPEKKTE
ncbi:hypothetical protein [Candidatus Pelagibacter sp.]|uniref:hypothetical protein n=1 Tax=Candidatus Pelagibacter sp. TaxID=2024849 RepID=UPI003F863002